MVTTKYIPDTQSTFKERPLLFSAPMVRAILADQKTQTRRILKVPSWSGCDNWTDAELEIGTDDKPYTTCNETGCLAEIHCPYGDAGDRLWVREAWLPARHGSYEPIPRDDKWIDLKSKWSCVAVHRSDYPLGHDDYDGHWRPSIHMPRWASRINLGITGIRVERLQDISEEDARAEGCTNNHLIHWPCGDPGYCHDVYRRNLAKLWESINGKGSWAANPWVRVIEFKRISR